VVVAIACSCAGCLQRRIHITSDPPGAAVWLNGVEIGRTPVEAAFTFYGDYDVRLHKDGYEPVAEAKSARAPWYEWPVLDLFSTAAPWTIKTVVRWDFALEPSPDLASQEAGPARDALLERAEEMRRRAGVVQEAPPDVPEAGAPPAPDSPN
jgi:hypothetical protein